MVWYNNISDFNGVIDGVDLMEGFTMDELNNTLTKANNA